MDDLTKYIETNLKYRLGLLTEAGEGEDAPAEDAPADAGDEGGDTGGDSADDIFSQDDVDAASKSMGGEKGDSDAADAPEGEDAPEGQETDSAAPPTATDDQKVREMFTDSGDPKIDFSLTADSNIRLARFKFKYAGIDPLTLMSDDEKKIGVRADELESRLTPDQYQIYIQKNKELRREFTQIASRERGIIIYNSNIPIFYNDENGVQRVITHKQDLKTAVDRIADFMKKSFGEDWVDNKKAIKYIQSIKVNFSDEKKVRPNLIPISYFQPVGERGVIAFNRIYSPLPPTIDKFIKDNMDIEDYKKSPLFRTFVNDFKGEDGVGSSRISVYPVISDPDAAAAEDAEAPADGAEDTGEGDAGAEDTGDTGEEDMSGDLGEGL
jgi:hypothetical protein